METNMFIINLFVICHHSLFILIVYTSSTCIEEHTTHKIKNSGKWSPCISCIFEQTAHLHSMPKQLSTVTWETHARTNTHTQLFTPCYNCKRQDLTAALLIECPFTQSMQNSFLVMYITAQKRSKWHSLHFQRASLTNSPTIRVVTAYIHQYFIWCHTASNITVEQETERFVDI